ncbi:GFA family protein [Microbulbifer variabilis]|uniref:GFA family protein n=1 Tax=Microbulbifer variabilis TaxID=266805 RepID=UPI003365A56E
MEEFMPITGECFYGDIQYRVSGKLRDAKSCHCSRCRKAFSVQASASAFVDPNEFEWLSGESLLTSFIGKYGYGLQFCKNCGSTLCTIHNGKVFQVTLGSVNGSPDIEISQHIFVGSKANWEVIPKGVLQFHEGPE